MSRALVKAAVILEVTRVVAFAALAFIGVLVQLLSWALT